LARGDRLGTEINNFICNTIQCNNSSSSLLMFSTKPPAHPKQPNQNREVSRESDWLSSTCQHFRIKMLQKFPTGDIMTTTRSTMVFFHYSASGSAECDLWRTVDSIFFWRSSLSTSIFSTRSISLVTHSMRKGLVISSLLTFSLLILPSSETLIDPSPAAKRRRGSNQQGEWEVACLFFSWRSVWETR
jgi:hypothetical protein